jgi:hypothetical protein
MNRWLSISSRLIADLSRVQEKAILLEERTTCIDSGYLTVTREEGVQNKSTYVYE